MTGQEALFLQLDLSDVVSVKRAAEDFMRYVFLARYCEDTNLIRVFVVWDSKEPKLHVLVNNG